MKSIPGVAIRARLIGKDRFEYFFAVATVNGPVFVISGRSGLIRRLESTDQLRTDWEPFQERPGGNQRKRNKINAALAAEKREKDEAG